MRQSVAETCLSALSETQKELLIIPASEEIENTQTTRNVWQEFVQNTENLLVKEHLKTGLHGGT